MQKITAYGCDHCLRLYRSRSGVRNHERHCWHNPTRTPKEGEVYGMNHGTISVDDTGFAPWEPDHYGMIYVDGEWHDFPGYERITDEDYDGDEYQSGESWPAPKWTKVRADKLPKSERIDMFHGRKRRDSEEYPF